GPRLRVELEPVGDVLAGVAVRVDLEVVAGSGRERVPVGTGRGIFAGNDVGEDRHGVRLVRAPERVQVGEVGRGILGDERCLAVRRRLTVARTALHGSDHACPSEHRVGRVAYGLAFRVLRDERLAEDAVQEGFLAVWRAAAAFRAERAKASTWILTLVHRRAVDLVRREERRRTEPLAEEVAAHAGEN